MTDKITKNNHVTISGEIVSDFIYDHEESGECFYMVNVSVKRLSDNLDIIPVMVSERLIDVNADYKGMSICVDGQFQSRNMRDGHKNRLILSVFAQSVYLQEDACEISKSNQIYLDGYICKKPVYRKTPLGREIADLLIAVNRPYDESDYIPCICWGRNARYADNFTVGEQCVIWGRIQSREYIKKTGDNNVGHRVAYEVSISKIDAICNEKEKI